MSGQPLKVFISYSHKDEALKNELEEHLALLKRLGKIQIWQDRAIDAGEEWNEKIRQALDTADIILLLVTSRFINSDFCFSKEMHRAMMRHEQKTARVIPIIIAPCSWQDAPFSKLQVLPTDGKSVTEWSNRDSAFLKVTEGVTRVVDKLYSPTEKDDDGWSTPPAINSSQNASGSTPPVNVFQGLPKSSLPPEFPKPPHANPTQPTANLYQKRMELFTLLSSLPGPQFEQIVFALRPPAGNVPPSPAPPGQRVPALLEWAESPIGCGLDALGEVVNAVVSR